MGDLAEEYFRTERIAEKPDPAFPPLFTTRAEIPIIHLAEGVRFQPVFGKNLLVYFVSFDPYAEAPVHQHAEEQMGTILEGEMEFELDGVKRLLRPGDVYFAPPYVPHGARTYATS